MATGGASADSASKTIDKFKVFNIIGQGKYGIVFQAQNIDTQERVAAKKITKVADQDVSKVVAEIENMKRVSHPNLVKLLHHYSDAKNIFWLFLELCDLGDLQKYFINKQPSHLEKINMMQQMTEGVKFLHDNGIVHRDIKPQNILVKSSDDGHPVVKITDFGLAKMADSATGSFQTHDIGTWDFMAPELFDYNSKLDRAVDIFALGITLYAMIIFNERSATLIPREGVVQSHQVPIGNQMFHLLKMNKAEIARGYHKEVIPVKGEGAERRIREMVQNMIKCDAKERLQVIQILQQLDTIAAEEASVNKTQLSTPVSTEGSPSSISRDELESFTVVNHLVQSISSDSQKPNIAASVTDCDNKTKLTIRIWQLKDEKNLSWEEQDIVVDHSLRLKRSPQWAEVLTILEKLLLLVRIDLGGGKHQFVGIDAATGRVPHKSQIHQCLTVPGYCSHRSKVLIPDKKKSSINMLAAPALVRITHWTHDEVHGPEIVCSNKTRLTVLDTDATIIVFEWNDELPQTILYRVQMVSCENVQLHPCNTLVAINKDRQWSVWNEDGTAQHTLALPASLVNAMKINPWRVIQDPVSGFWYLQESGKLADGKMCHLFYNTQIQLDRFDSDCDQIQVKNDKLVVNKTTRFK